MTDSQTIQYRVDATDPGAHVFAVRCRVPQPDPAGQQLSLPAWIPGSYLVRDYARHVLAISAKSGKRELAVTKTSKATWQIAPCEGPLELCYEVYAYDLSVRGAYLDKQRGFFNGVCLFVSVAGAADCRCEVEIIRPRPAAGGTMDGWRVATAMRAIDIDTHGFGRYGSENYDELIDHPFEISDFTRTRFEAGGVPHEIVLAGNQRADLERLRDDLPRICEQHMQLFADGLPTDRYVFLVNVVGEGYGGLEHRASSALITRRSDLPREDSTEIDKPYRRFLGLVSHEYFHLWNIKRIKPAAFTPFELDKEAYTSLLWVFEGVTSYYDDLALVRSGLIDADAYLVLLAENISKVWQTPGRHRQTLAESSFDTWIKLYKPDENSANAVISYYTKGSLAALALDLTIRNASGGKKSLDDVMRELWRRYGKTGRGLEEEGFEQLAEEISGVSLGAFFDLAIRSTADLPLQELLGGIGVMLEFTSVAEGVGEGAVGATPPRCALGLKIRDDNGKAVLANVLAGGPAQEAGLAGGDELLALGGLKVTPASYATLLSQYKPGERARITVFRRDELMEFELEMAAAPALKCKLSMRQDAAAETAHARAAWLGNLNQTV